MNKSVLLGIIVVLAIMLVAILIFFSPEKNLQSIEFISKNQQPAIKQNNNIIYQEKHKYPIESVQSSKKDKKGTFKKVDPTIKAATIDHYNSYLIQLIDENPQDRDVHLVDNQPNSYIYVDGKVNGKEYVLKVPRAILNSSGIKLRITNLKTKKVTEIDAAFLSEAAALPSGATFRANIDTKTKDVVTDVDLPEENPPFPTLRE